MGERVDFWELLRMQRRSTEAWRYRPATGLPVWLSIGRLTSDPAGRWFVFVSRKGLDSLICRDESEACADRHDLGVRLMEVCGPGRWEPAAT